MMGQLEANVKEPLVELELLGDTNTLRVKVSPPLAVETGVIRLTHHV